MKRRLMKNAKKPSAPLDIDELTEQMAIAMGIAGLTCSPGTSKSQSDIEKESYAGIYAMVDHAENTESTLLKDVMSLHTRRTRIIGGIRDRDPRSDFEILKAVGKSLKSISAPDRYRYIYAVWVMCRDIGQAAGSGFTKNSRFNTDKQFATSTILAALTTGTLIPPNDKWFEQFAQIEQWIDANGA
jgi:hypothetical protein